MSELWNVSSSPHVRSGVKTRHIMYFVLIALFPAACMGIWLFGLPALTLIVCSVAACVLTEYLFEVLMKKPVTIRDGSAMVTGLLLALNLPPQAPWWMAVLGGVFAILIVKQLFGGLGQNIMNPALGARCFLLLSFPGRMTDFSVGSASAQRLADTVSGATPLAEMKAGGSYDLLSLFVGNTRGTIGETSAVLLLLGGIFLVALKIIDLRIPLTYLGSFAVFLVLFGGHGLDAGYVAAQLCAGGLMLGAWFMATDYVTRPITPGGQYVYGVLLGVLTGLFRVCGGSAEGVSYAIIFANLLVPVIERLTVPAGFGLPGKRGPRRSGRGGTA